jgi:tetratricopeptide (TPR) repeat protein
VLSSDQETNKDIMPLEYQNIFADIPDYEKESFYHSLKSVPKDMHPYIRIINAIDKTLMVYGEPSPVWFYIYAKLSFIAAKYDDLFELWNISKYKEKIQFFPFIGRILTYQNEFDQALELCNKAIESISFDVDDLSLVDILVFFEAKFTIGLIQAYSRQLDAVMQTIESLESKSSIYRLKRIVSEDYFLDLLFYENILKVIRAFMSGQPKEMDIEVSTMQSWVPNIKDPWLKGYFYNLLGISQLQNQKMQDADISFKEAYKFFEVVHDLRGFTAVGANLGTSLISKGLRHEGRQYVESVLQPMVDLKNYRPAISNMVQISKSYLDEKKYEEASRLVNWAEELSTKTNIVEPATFSYLCYFYSKLGDKEKANKNLNKLRDLQDKSDGKETDIYTSLWYYNAASVFSMAIGDLNNANENILSGIENADKNGHYDFSLDLSTILLEILLKRYLIEQNERYLIDAIALLDDLGPLIKKMDNVFYETISTILKAYLYLAVDNHLEARTLYDKANLISQDLQQSEQYSELLIFKRRIDFLSSQTDTKDVQLLKDWLSTEYLPIIFTMESKRLLANLQFQSTNLGVQPKESEKYPIMLIIIGQAGTTMYSHSFRKDETGFDEVLVGGFLGALTSFSQELFGGGMLTRIDQENHVLLIEKISDQNLLILIVDDETYSIRKKFKRFSQELAKMKVVDYLESDIYLTEQDPQWQILESLIEIVFTLEEA